MSLEKDEVEKKVKMTSVFEVQEEPFIYLRLKEDFKWKTKKVDLATLKMLGGYFNNIIYDAQHYQNRKKPLILNFTWGLFTKMTNHALRKNIYVFKEHELKIMRELSVENYVWSEMESLLHKQLELLQAIYDKIKHNLDEQLKEDEMKAQVVEILAIFKQVHIPLNDQIAEILKLQITGFQYFLAFQSYFKKQVIKIYWSHSNYIFEIPSHQNWGEEVIYHIITDNQKGILNVVFKFLQEKIPVYKFLRQSFSYRLGIITNQQALNSCWTEILTII